MAKDAGLYTESNGAEIAELLVGRRIVQADLGACEHRASDNLPDQAEGRLVLDDGTVLHLYGNDGGCCCGAGDYELTKVATVDNIITSARVECLPGGDDYACAEGVYRIYVIADNAEVNVAEFAGTDGNGYYGTGFALTVGHVEGDSR